MKFTFVSLIEAEKYYIRNKNLIHHLNQGRHIVWRTGGSMIQKK